MRHTPAGVIVIVIAALLATSFIASPTVKNLEVKTEISSSHQSNSRKLGQGVAPINKNPQTKHYEPDCSKKENADLCAQQRMADAARYGLGLLLLTFGAAFWAAFEANRVARAAVTTNEIAAHSTERQLRAYLSIEFTRINFSLETNIIEAFYKITNHGQTPASNVMDSHSFKVLPWPLKDDALIGEARRDSHSSVFYIAPGSKKTGRASQLFIYEAHPVKSSRFRIYLITKVAYQDAFGNDRQLEYCGTVEGFPEMLNSFEATGSPTPVRLVGVHEKAN